MITGYERENKLNIPYIVSMLLCITMGFGIGITICRLMYTDKEVVKTVFVEKIIPVPTSIPTPVPTQIEKTTLKYGFKDSDIYLLAQLLCGDKNKSGDGEYDIDFRKEINYYEVGKVLNIVMNRVNSHRFPDTVRDVILQRGQFAVMPANTKKKPSDTALRIVKEWCDMYDKGYSVIQIIPEKHLYFSGNGTINRTR